MTHTVTLAGDAQRQRAKAMIDRAPLGYVVTFREKRRSDEQNDKMHVMLQDIARSKPLGRVHTKDEWKVILLHEIDRDMTFEMDLRGKPFPLGYRSSQLTVRQMTDFIEYLYVFGVEHGVIWTERKDAA